MQEEIWDKEYKKSKLLVKENIPSSDVVRFVKFLRKTGGIEIENQKVLDLGSGMGRNSFYLAELGAKVIGLEISKTAIQIAEKNAHGKGSNIKYIKQSIGEKFPVGDDSIDIVLDVTSSNSLNEVERGVYLTETKRVLKTGGYFFVKALCKDGDDNAKYLIKNFPGKECDTYVLPELGVVERVWSKDDFISMYGKYFTITSLEKKTSYSRMNNRSYKRNFWIVHLECIR